MLETIFAAKYFFVEIMLHVFMIIDADILMIWFELK